jgi:hypothetical protein
VLLRRAAALPQVDSLATVADNYFRMAIQSNSPVISIPGLFLSKQINAMELAELNPLKEITMWVIILSFIIYLLS